jgi:hypothetical protein
VASTSSPSRTEPWDVPKSPLPTVSPTLTSGQPTKLQERGLIRLKQARSEVIEEFGLRISAPSVFDTFAALSMSTDEKAWDTKPSVGESMVMTNQGDGEDDYIRWYRVVLDSIGAEGAVLERSLGTRRAPSSRRGNTSSASATTRQPRRPNVRRGSRRRVAGLEAG